MRLMAGRWLLGHSGAGVATAAAPTGDGREGDGAAPRAALLAVRADGWTEVSLDELERLADTDGLSVVSRLTQRRERPDPATYVGGGKVEELRQLTQDQNLDVVVADGELTPAQLRNLEQRVGVRVVDRTALILDIFAEHARSSEGKAQVELAQLAYQLPRLRGAGQAMSRMGGGRVAGGTGMGGRGPGEMRLETERRRLRQRMTTLRRRIAETGRRRERTRGRRASNRVPSVAIAGYTNAGKSQLLNRLTGADVLVQDQLFATLDPTVRRARTKAGRDYTFTDTVGFVRHLPHQLVDAFRSTLEEVTRADLVIHVVDAAAADAMDQVTAVRGVLYEIGATDVPELLVLNKTDIAPDEWLQALQRAYPEAVAVSARTGEGMEELRRRVDDRLRGMTDLPPTESAATSAH
jgi:GTPase